MAAEASSSSTKENKTDNANSKMLALILKQLPDKSLDWDAIVTGMPPNATGGTTTVAAARERWRRYKIANGITEVKPKVTGTDAGNGTISASTAKAKTPVKRKSSGDGEVNNDDGGEVATPAKKAARKSKAPVSASVVKDSENGDGGESEHEAATPVKKAKQTPKKAAPAAKKATPAKSKVAKKDPVAENEAADGAHSEEAAGDDDNIAASSDQKKLGKPDVARNELIV